jgi:hypothetical protein
MERLAGQVPEKSELIPQGGTLHRLHAAAEINEEDGHMIVPDAQSSLFSFYEPPLREASYGGRMTKIMVGIQRDPPELMGRDYLAVPLGQSRRSVLL